MTKEEIQRTRKRLGYTQAAFAAALSVDKGTVWRWEKGKSKISPVYQKLILAMNEPIKTQYKP
jgi:DNA-binding transcriptional regulator YiaG